MDTPTTEERLMDDVWDTNGDPIFQAGYRSTDQVRELFELIGERGHIAGSMCAWMAELEEPGWTPGDIDIFAVSDEAFGEIEALLKANYVQMFRMSNALVSAFRVKRKFNDQSYLPVQVVKPHPSWEGSDDIRRDIVLSFDLTCSRGLLTGYNDNGCPELYGDIYLGELDKVKIIRVNNPVKTLARMLKYHRRGYEFSAWEQIKVLLSWDMVMDDKKGAITEELHDEEFREDSGGWYASWYEDDDHWSAE